MFEPEAAYDEDVVSLNDDDNTAGAESETVMSVIDGDKPDHDDDSSPDDEPPPPRGGRPALRVVNNQQALKGLFCLVSSRVHPAFKAVLR